MANLPEYVSKSQINGFLRCGKQYELERVVKVPTPPTWYFIGGTAVHKATERLDQEKMDSWSADRIEHLWSQAYGEEIDEAYRIWPEDRDWLKFGRVSRNNKDGQGFRYWNERGRSALMAWADWRRSNRDTMHLVSIEEEFLVPIGGVQVRGFIDRVFQSRDHGYYVVDIKNGSKRPDSPLELAIYKHGWEIKHEATGAVGLGGFWMGKDGELFPQELEPYTIPLLSGLIEKYLDAVANNTFLPRVSGDCFNCPVKSACATKSGATPEALLYDSLLKEKVSV